MKRTSGNLGGNKARGGVLTVISALMIGSAVLRIGLEAGRPLRARLRANPPPRLNQTRPVRGTGTYKPC